MACCSECSIVWLPNYLCVCSSPYREHREAQLSVKAEHQTRCQTASQSINGGEKGRKRDKAYAEVKYRRMGFPGVLGTFSGGAAELNGKTKYPPISGLFLVLKLGRNIIRV